MRSVFVRRSAESQELIKLATITEMLGLTDAMEINQIRRLITAVSSQVEDYTDRVFARELITERMGLEDIDTGPFGSGNTRAYTHRMMLSRRPILAIEAIRFDGEAVDLDGVVVEDVEAGILYSTSGFGATTVFVQQLERVRTHFNEPLYEVDYSAGYVLPTFPTATKTFVSGDVNVTTDKITIASHTLVTGDVVRFSVSAGGALPAGLSANRDYYVFNAGDNDFSVTPRPGAAVVDITSGGSGTHTVTRRETLPPALQNDIVQLVTTEFHSRKRDRSVKSEKLGDYAVTYGSEGDNAAVSIMQRLDRYRTLA